MSRRKFKGNKDKCETGAFIRLPHNVMESNAYLASSPHARMLLLELALQYKGHNNGDLSGAWSLMQGRGFRSKGTLTKAKRELMHTGLIVETRMGRRPNKASLYALTWLALDEQPKFDITAKDYQRGLYKLYKPNKENQMLSTPADPNNSP